MTNFWITVTFTKIQNNDKTRVTLSIFYKNNLYDLICPQSKGGSTHVKHREHGTGMFGQSANPSGGIKNPAAPIPSLWNHVLHPPAWRIFPNGHYLFQQRHSDTSILIDFWHWFFSSFEHDFLYLVCIVHVHMRYICMNVCMQVYVQACGGQKVTRSVFHVIFWDRVSPPWTA